MCSSSNSTAVPTLQGVKLAPPIHQALIIAEQHVDRKTYFTIRIIPHQTDIRYVNGVPVGIKAVTRQPYSISRNYDELYHFCQRLHDAFPPCNHSHSRHPHYGPRIPKLTQKRLQLLNHNKHLQRRIELEAFLATLFRLPASISQSLLVLEFFGPHHTKTVTKQASSPLPLVTLESPQWHKRLFWPIVMSASKSTTTLLSSPPASPLISAITSTISTTTSTSRRRYQPSRLTRSSSSTISSASSSVCSQDSTTASSTIKIKVIYDVDNIVVIRVPRSASLVALKARIRAKFGSDPTLSLPEDFGLVYNADDVLGQKQSSDSSIKSGCGASTTSAASCFSAKSDWMTWIEDDEGVKALMQTDKAKVTLRLVAPRRFKRRPSLI
ncbi:hypothetical protein BX666DRAFT_1924774 [Dichotomocladium elegans]|nr:hypothetical protein BX666DRAFT_1924774 [Dichotomocladium elegans]